MNESLTEKPHLLPDWLDADATALSGAVAPAATLAAAPPHSAKPER